MDEDALDTVLACLREMESIVLSLKQLRPYVKGASAGMLESVIIHAERKIAEIKRRVVQ